MKIQINGEVRELEFESLPIPELLAVLKVKDPMYVTIELNGEILSHDSLSEHFVKDGDQLEFLYFMGGGR